MGEAQIAEPIAPPILRPSHPAASMPHSFGSIASAPSPSNIEIGKIHPPEQVIETEFNAHKTQLNDPLPEKDYGYVPSVERPHFHPRPKGDDAEPYIDRSKRNFGAKYSPEELQKMQVRHAKSKRHDKGDPGVETHYVSERIGALKKDQIDTKNLRTLMKDPYETGATDIRVKKQKQHPVHWQEAEKIMAQNAKLITPALNKISYGTSYLRRPKRDPFADRGWTPAARNFGKNRFR